MRQGVKCLAGLTVAAMPLLHGLSPAGAAEKRDDDSATVDITSRSGTEWHCGAVARHTVDSATGELTAFVATGSTNETFPLACRARIEMAVAYTNRDGRVVILNLATDNSTTQEFFTSDAGAGPVTIDAAISFADCVGDNCEIALRTHTK